MLFPDNAPIIACSTGTNTNTAIAILRLSGFDNILDLQIFFSFDLKKIKYRYSHLSNLLHNSTVIDNVLITFFPLNSSYNGENVLEISVHGNQLNIARIIDIFVSSNKFRHALHGEFSFRAFKNKKLTLTQVEGLDLLLNANSSLMLDQGLQILQGELHQNYQVLYSAFLKLKAAIEISIDFSEDVGESETAILLSNTFLYFKDVLSSLHSRTLSPVSSLLLPDIVLSGEANAGKSSLFNLLLKHNRSIVSSSPGTTRDYVSELVTIDGTNFRLVDTAGIRDSSDSIESEGIDRSFDLLQTSFFKILIIDPHVFNLNYLHRLDKIEFDLVLLSHSDSPFFIGKVASLDLSFIHYKFIFQISNLSGSIEPLENFGPIEPLKNSGPIEPLKNFGPIEPLKNFGPIEPLKNSGPIEPLLKKLVIDKFSLLASQNPILIERHRTSIKKIYSKFLEVEEVLSSTQDVAIISSEINTLGLYLTELVGIVSPDQVLDSIFSNFCIGK